jgi:glycosyltransferase involved in cell wall biosynthesis
MLLKLIESAELRRQLGEAALERAQQQFNWKKIAQQYLNCYNEVLKTSAGN